jgi:hypothetical protein
MTQCLAIGMNASNLTLSAKWINGCSTATMATEGCGADIAKCEGNDPLHDFDLDDGTPTPTANHDYDDYNQMSLAIPSQVPDRIDNK